MIINTTRAVWSVKREKEPSQTKTTTQQQHVQDKVLLAFETVDVVEGCNHSNKVEILYEF